MKLQVVAVYARLSWSRRFGALEPVWGVVSYKMSLWHISPLIAYLKANEEDDKKDLNEAPPRCAAERRNGRLWTPRCLGKDGIADVQQMSYNELINHKALPDAAHICRGVEHDGSESRSVEPLRPKWR